MTKQIYFKDEAIRSLQKIDLSAVPEKPETENLSIAQQPHDLAYVIFTSGSTGVPKGVALDNLGPVNTVLDINRKIALADSDVVFGISELNFDLSVYDIFGTAFAGAALLIPPDGAAKNPELCFELLTKYRPTIWNSVPALAQLLMEYLKASNANPGLPIRTFLLSGDWIPLTLPDLLKHYSGASVLSLGGATEASIWSIYYPIKSLQPEWSSVPYGYPLDNQHFFVLDKKLQSRPNNVAGDLYIGGIGLAKCYWDDVEKTNSAFFNHPETGQRIYKTGDLGIFRDPGFIEFLGREDGQVKIRGYRIELGEIEAALQRHPMIQNAVVKVIGEGQNAYIAGYWVSQHSPKPQVDELKDFLALKLPEYMVPTRFIELTEIPLGATGKIDRKSLPTPSAANEKPLASPPKTLTEIALAKLWSNILNVTSVDRYDNFFDLGGTSFDAVRLIVALNAKFETKLTISELLKSPDLFGLAVDIDRGMRNVDEQPSLLVSFPQQPGKQNAFMFHPSGGNVLCYRELAQQSSSFNIVGVRAKVGTSSVKSFDEMIECYVDEIMSVQSQGPYFLGGWSMGGVIAYAAAKLFLKNGHDVGALWMIDAPKPLQNLQEEFYALNLKQWFVCDLLEEDTAPEMTSLTNDSSIETIIVELQSLGLIETGADAELIEAFQTFSWNIRLLNQYSPAPLDIDCPVLIAAATKRVEYRVAMDSQFYWADLVKCKAKNLRLETNHYGILRGNCLNTIVKEISSHVLCESI